MTNVVGLKLAVGQIPNLDIFVPATGDNDGVGIVGGESDTANPIRVSLILKQELQLNSFKFKVNIV